MNCTNGVNNTESNGDLQREVKSCLLSQLCAPGQLLCEVGVMSDG